MTYIEIVEHISFASNPEIINKEMICKIISSLEEDFEYFKSNLDKNKLGSFLYNAAHQYNRFSVPSPFIIEPDFFNIFSRILDIFEQIETSNINTASLLIDKYSWIIFDYIIDNSRYTPNIQPILGVVKSALYLQPPQTDETIRVFNQQRLKLFGYLNGYLNNNLYTILETSVPVTPIKQKTVISSNFRGKVIEITLNPSFSPTAQSFVIPDGTFISIPTSTSNWQNCVCYVKIIIKGLVDEGISQPGLSIPYGVVVPYSQWPNLFTYTFDLLNNLFWSIYKPEERIGRWILSPNDLASISWSLYTANNRFEYILKGPPGIVTEISTYNTSVAQLYLPDIDSEIQWFQKCLLLSMDNLTSGNIKESLFWLNVGIEALLEYRSNKICKDNGIDFNELNSGKSYWLSAKEIVEEQDKELASKIEWPESAVGVPSWYSKIKYLFKIRRFTVTQKEVLYHFNNINKKRNSLFHGNKSTTINSEDISSGIDSFMWLINNFE